MTDNTVGVSRRKVLSAVGTIGAAAALGGTGSLAFFSDEEEFSNNRLTAGSLDLKVGWQEYYADWSDDEADAVGDVLMPEGPGQSLQEIDYPDDYAGLPVPNNALVAIPDADLQAFLDAAAMEAYPDTGGDGLIDYPEGYDVCVHGADSPEDLDPTAETLAPNDGDGTGLRSTNDDTVDPDTGAIKPLVAIDDVKPGDFGEVTLGAHLCGNDGFLWLRGETRFDDDVSQTEPERKDLDEADGLASGELADDIRVTVWYDSVDTNDDGQDDDLSVDDPAGNNLVDDGEVLIEEGSLSAFLDVASAGNGIPLRPPSDDGAGAEQFTLTCEPDVGTIAQPGSDGIEEGQSLTVSGDTGDSMVTISNVVSAEESVLGYETFDFEFDGPETVAGGNYIGVCGLEIEGTDGTATVEYGPGGCVRTAVYLPRTDVGTIESVTFDFCVYEGPQLTGNPDDWCFDASNTYYVGFAWWLPVDHANELQTDSVGFDLGFYAEQCRHNPGPADGTETG
jgi:predicted ribosomally synthesized peptide with SipW-like signal peptide